MIVFNEKQYAENLDKQKSIQTNIIKNGIILAKLYISKGYTDKEIFDLLWSKYDVIKNYDIKYKKIDLFIKCAKEGSELENKTIKFSNNELDFIHKIGNITYEKIFFVLFCISKIYNNRYFYFTDREIFRCADVSWNGNNSKDIFQYLILNNYIEYKIKKIEKNYGDEKIFYKIKDEISGLFNENNVAFEISNFDNIIFYYLDYIKSGDFMICNNCGKIIKRTSNNQLYCKQCSQKKYRK